MDTHAVERMDTFSHDDLRSLLDSVGIAVSIFLPIEAPGQGLQQNMLRLEQLLGRAEAQLQAHGLSVAAAQMLLAPAWQLAEDRGFWEHQYKGLAIFIAPDLFRVYRLPLPFDELLLVEERCHITPLLPLLTDDGTFYLLTLGLQHIQLFQGSRFCLRPMALPGAPTSLQETLAYIEFAKQPQWHPGVPGRGGARRAIFHGQGARDGRVVKEEIFRYFQLLDHKVHLALHAKHAPLLLAGLAYLLPIYREANSYPPLEAQGIAENPDDLQPEALHARAWAIVAPRFERARIAAVERYQQLAGTQPALVSGEARAVVPAAHAGRVDTLFVAAGQHQWGGFDPVSGVLTLHEVAGPRDGDLLNVAAAQTILHGGKVYVIAPEQLPQPAALSAIFRY